MSELEGEGGEASTGSDGATGVSEDDESSGNGDSTSEDEGATEDSADTNGDGDGDTNGDGDGDGDGDGGGNLDCQALGEVPDCPGATIATFADVLALEGCKVVTGSIAFANHPSMPLDDGDLWPLSCLEEIEGSLTQAQGQSLTIPLEMIELPALRRVGGEVFFGAATDLRVVSLPVLESVGTDVFVGVNSITEFRAPALTSVRDLWLNRPHELEVLDLGALSIATGDVLIDEVDALAALELGALTTASSLIIVGNLGLTSIDIASLTNVEKSIQVYGSPSLSSLRIDSLETVGGVIITGGPALVDLRFPALTSAQWAVSVRQTGISSLANFPPNLDTPDLQIANNTSLCSSTVDDYITLITSNGFSGSTNLLGNNDGC